MCSILTKRETFQTASAERAASSVMPAEQCKLTPGSSNGARAIAWSALRARELIFDLTRKDKNSTNTEESTSEYLQMSQLKSTTVNKREKNI